MAGDDRHEPSADLAPPDWLEAARQAFLWRYFYADWGRSDRRNSGPGVRGVPPFERPKRPKTPVNAGGLGASAHPTPARSGFYRLSI